MTDLLPPTLNKVLSVRVGLLGRGARPIDCQFRPRECTSARTERAPYVPIWRGAARAARCVLCARSVRGARAQIGFRAVILGRFATPSARRAVGFAIAADQVSREPAET